MPGFIKFNYNLNKTDDSIMRNEKTTENEIHIKAKIFWEWHDNYLRNSASSILWKLFVFSVFDKRLIPRLFTKTFVGASSDGLLF